MSKRTFMTNITPLPPTVSRDVVIAFLHDHHSMIKLNPLVLRHEDAHPPSNASRDEKERAVWYEITDKISYLPGGVATGEVSYKACFYNLPLGLQTHVFAPAGVDIRSKWTVGGNMPGEPKEAEELGLNVPRDVLYIKEEVDLRCNILMSSFVRKNLKRSHLVVADKIIEKASEIGPAPVSPQQYGSSRTAAHPNRILTRETTVPQPAADDDSLPALESLSLVHYSYPPNCACEGVEHNRSCTFHGRADVFAAVKQHKQKPFYAISLPSDSSLAMVSPSGVRSVETEPLPELYGSARRNTCLCTGALHEVGCPSYPGLRIALPSRSGFNGNSSGQDPERRLEAVVSPTHEEDLETDRLHRLGQDIQRWISQQDSSEATASNESMPTYNQTDRMPSPSQTRAKD